MRGRLALHLALGVAGALLISLPAQHYRIDLATCATAPPPTVRYLLSAAYLAAVALLTACWLLWWRAAPRLSITLLAGLLIHATALLAPPFLSQDPLFYAAIGRAMATYHASPYVALDQVLPSSDVFWRHLPDRWQAGTSAYFGGWNQLCHAVGLVGGEQLITHLRIYQAIGLAAMVGSAALAGLAAGHATEATVATPPTSREERVARGAALVLFCPLAVIEGTQSAHNDALLALAVAGFVYATVKRHPLLGALALVASLAVKASALLLFGIVALQIFFSRFRATALRLGIAVALLCLVAVVVAPRFAAAIAAFTLMLGSPTDTALYCTRSIECLPRNILNTTHHYAAAWAVGVAGRAVGALWLLGCALASSPAGARLSGLALGVFVYYVYLHGWMQSWYLLPLLPLLPFAARRHFPAMAAACVSSVMYYAVKLSTDCESDVLTRAIGPVVETIVVLLPPTALLFWSRRATARG